MCIIIKEEILQISQNRKIKFDKRIQLPWGMIHISKKKKSKGIRATKINIDYVQQRGFPGGSDGKESACNAGNLALTPVCLPGEFHGKSSLVGYSPWVREEWDITE